mmetsp:Transcript_29758/g.94700  ORF Transcript_29758/g.94700 Transcript_29758/m.94700 type:complete len:487 (-) Transcript_29758:619-2079(-)
MPSALLQAPAAASRSSWLASLVSVQWLSCSLGRRIPTPCPAPEPPPLPLCLATRLLASQTLLTAPSAAQPESATTSLRLHHSPPACGGRLPSQPNPAVIPRNRLLGRLLGTELSFHRCARKYPGWGAAEHHTRSTGRTMTDVTARFGRKKIQRSTSFDRFQKMRQAGAGFGDAMVAVWQGKEMTTEAEAATCIQRWWRACSCIKRFQESRKAVTAIQAGYRGMSVRLCLGMSDVSLSQTATSRQNDKQERAASEQDEKFQIFCATLLQAQWRGRQMRLRHGLMRRPAPNVVRAFSWSKSSRRSGAASTPPVKPPARRQANGEASLGRHPDGSSTKPVKRSSSFDRLASALRGNRTSRASTARGSPGSVTFGSAGAVSAQPQARPELLYITLMKGRNRGLGLELDSKNTVSFIVPGGAADMDGQFLISDTIVSVDGVQLNGLLLQEVMNRNAEAHTFGVWRIARLDVHPQPEHYVARRTMSFDRRAG